MKWARNYAIGVCGFPRSGSSLLMRMLDAGGIPPVDGSAFGSYEVKDFGTLATIPPQDLIGRSIKLLDYFQWHDRLPDVPWRFVWSDRRPRQQALSQVKLMRAIGVRIAPFAADGLATSLRHDRGPLLSRYRAVGVVHHTSFEALLRYPTIEAAGLSFAFDGEFDAASAAAVVVPRAPDCAPDLRHELDLLKEMRALESDTGTVSP